MAHTTIKHAGSYHNVLTFQASSFWPQFIEHKGIHVSESVVFEIIISVILLFRLFDRAC